MIWNRCMSKRIMRKQCRENNSRNVNVLLSKQRIHVPAIVVFNDYSFMSGVMALWVFKTARGRASFECFHGSF